MEQPLTILTDTLKLSAHVCLDRPPFPSADLGVDILNMLTDVSVMLIGPIVLLVRQGSCSWYRVTAIGYQTLAWKKGQHSSFRHGNYFFSRWKKLVVTAWTSEALEEKLKMCKTIALCFNWMKVKKVTCCFHISSACLIKASERNCWCW